MKYYDKFNRTLEEAFGPYTSRKIESNDDPIYDWQDVVVVWGCIAVAVLSIMLVITGIIL